MHPLYEKAMELAEKIRLARLDVVQLSAKLSEAEYELRIIQAKVERGWIKKVGGEKSLAPTVEDRERIFTLALDADEEYKKQLKLRNEIQMKLEEAKVEVSALHDKLNIMLAAMKSNDST